MIAGRRGGMNREQAFDKSIMDVREEGREAGV